MSKNKSSGGALQFLLPFAAIYLGLQFVLTTFFPQGEQQAPVPGPIITATAKSIRIGNNPAVTVHNVPATTSSHGVGGWIQSKFCVVRQAFGGADGVYCPDLAAQYTGETFTLKSRCPAPPFDLYSVVIDGAEETFAPLSALEDPVRCPPDTVVTPGVSSTVDLAPWKYAFFEKQGTIEIRIPGTESTGSGAIAARSVARIQVNEPGAFTKVFRTFITAPFLNFLIFAASIAPGYNLGIAIILLTLFVKILLFFPTQHALEGQKKMQLLQPKIEELRKKYASDQKKLQEETMHLWKEHKINPFSSCLPLVIQFPILIGLFYVIRDGSDLALSRDLIYSFNQNLSWHFGTGFLGLDLLKPNVTVMPFLLVALQFFQMKLSFAIQKRKKKSDDAKKEKQSASPDVLQQRMMTYLLPLMIGVFAFQFPSAVSLYWGISTLFGIGQQLIVNRGHLKV